MHSSWQSFLAVATLLQAAPTPGPDLAVLQARLEGVERRLAEERRTWLEFRKSARSAEERAEIAAAFPRDEFAEELAALAGEAPGSEVAARAWIDAFRLACLLDDRELYESSLGRLLADHLHSPAISGLTLELVYGAPDWSAQQAAAALRSILAANDGEDVQANGLAQLALLVGLDPRFGEAGRAEAIGLLEQIGRRFAGRDFLGQDAAQFVAGARHEIEHLAVGQVAPDASLVDQDGVAFRLSDYRGRVVVLDFWGFV